MRPSERQPVPFIGGQHRSGTTLLRLLRDAHPQLAIPPETQFIPLAAERCAGAAVPVRAAHAARRLRRPRRRCDAIDLAAFEEEFGDLLGELG